MDGARRVIKREAGVVLIELTTEGAGERRRYLLESADPEGTHQAFTRLPDAEQAFVEEVRRSKERKADRP